jgi:hypothetical protein
MTDDYAFEMNHDLNRSTMTLDDEAAERVEAAREGLLTAVGMMTAGIPKDPSPEDIVGLTRLAASCVRFRNVIRAEFIKHDPDLELPEGFNEAEGHYDPDTVH